MEKLLPSNEMPNWAKRDIDANMAECPGCIAEQGLHHTCGMSHLEGLTHKMVISADQPPTPLRHFTDSPVTYVQQNGHHHHHQHHHAQPPVPPHHCHSHSKPVVSQPMPKYSSASVNPQRCTHSGGNSTKVTTSSLATKPNKTPPQKQSQHVSYVYSPERPIEGARYIAAPVDGGAQQGVLEMPYQPYHLVQHPLQYTVNQRVPQVAPLMQSPQAFMSCSHGSYGDILYATEHYHRMCNQKHLPENQYQQYHLVKHMYNVAIPHGDVMYTDSPTFINSEVMQDLCNNSLPQHCVAGGVPKSPPVCQSPDPKHYDGVKTKSKSVSTEGLCNVLSSHRGSNGSNRTSSSSSRSTPDSPVLHRVDKRRSLAGTDSELETVKKCTPLYGQPSWWGGWYDDGPDEKPSQDNGRLNDKRTGSGTYIAERPSSLSLHPTTATPPPSNTCSPSHAIPSPVVPPTACWYTVEVIKPVVDLPGTHQPPVNDGYVSESERLLEDFKQRTLKAALWTPPERDPGPGDNPQHLPPKLASFKPRINMSGTAFTIDLRDSNSSPEMPKISMGDSLSKFLPHKVRRSFKERSDKMERSSARKAIAATAAAKQKNTRWQRRKSTTAVSPAVRKKQFGSASVQRRSGYLSDGHHSAFSSDNEDFSITSEIIPRSRTRQTQIAPARHSGVMKHQNSARQKATSKTGGGNSRTPTGQGKVTSSAGRSKEAPSSYLEARQLRHSLHSGKVHDVAKKSAPPKSTVAPSSHKTTKSLYKSVSMPQSPSGHHTDLPEDNVSEAGTYTIDNEEQVDLDKSAVLKARLDIDRLFGLEPMDSRELQSCCPAPDDIDVGKMSLEELMKQKPPSQPVTSENAVISSDAPQVISPTSDAPQVISPTRGSFDLPQWVCQWSGAASSTTMVQDRSEYCPDTEVDNGHTSSCDVKHGGGCKLPSVPAKTHQQPLSTDEGERNDVDDADYLISVEHPSIDETGRRRATVSYDGTRGERFTVSFDAPATPPPRHVSASLTSDVTNIVHNELDGSTIDEKTSCDSDATVPVSFVIPIGCQGMPDSDFGNEATNSLNAEVLYELMKSGKNRRLVKQNTHVEPRHTHTADDKPKRNKAPWKRQPSVGIHRNHMSVDDHSESEASCVSDLSTDCSISSPHGRMKMPLSSMRTNRTFALRRARLNSSESDSSPKLSASVQQEKKPKSRPSSATDTSSRRKSAGISTKKNDEKLVRKDGGRFSMRVSKTTSSEQSSSTRSSEPRDSSRRNKPSSNIVRSLSTSSKSQPSSRSNSPRSQEYNSWKRRKEYDPRRAVTEAKLRDSVAKQASKSEISTSSEKSPRRHSSRHHGKQSVASSIAPSTVLSSTTLVPPNMAGSSKSLSRDEQARQEAGYAGSEEETEDAMEERIMQLSSEISYNILALARADEDETDTQTDRLRMLLRRQTFRMSQMHR